MSMIGKTLGNFEITSQLGKGGMGEVYQAKDRKLGRDVAIKVLPDEFARDADRVSRFQREAKLLAFLNHPNIAAIYGLEESSGTNFLVLELVDGDTLADRIKADPVPVEEALKLALQIAEALEAAHEKGVIHRDLKPANIKVTPEGKVKVLDFGLAKAFAGEQAELNLSNSPTLSNAATQQGVILGTAAYMSPEQARGKAVDKRADIWAFGCVLFEMLTGRAAFSGRDVTEILAAVIRAEPEWTSLPANLHWRLREVLEHCLKKEANDRYHDISDVKSDIQRVLADPSGVLVQPVTAAEPRRKLRTMLPLLAVAIVLSLIVGGVAVWILKPSELHRVMRFNYELPESQQLSAGPSLAISPDSSQFVYCTPKGIYLRSVAELDARLIPGTDDNPRQPFFSPDGQWVGYWSNNQLKKIAISGGSPVVLANAGNPMGPTWGADNTIVYSQVGKGIMQISANGGTPKPLIVAKDIMLSFPQLLPDGKTILFTLERGIGVQSLKTGERKVLFAGSLARYLPTGHIVYAGQEHNNLYAIAFDLDALEPVGGGVPIVQGARQTGLGVPIYAVSDSGTLIYVPGASASTIAKRSLVWVDRNGKEDLLAAAPNAYMHPRISPDGTRIALAIMNSANSDIWVWDLIRKSLTRLTFDQATDFYPLWTPDGKRIGFTSIREKNVDVYWKAADGTGEVELLGSVPGRLILPSSWSGDGNTLVLEEISGIGLPTASPIAAYVGQILQTGLAISPGGTEIGIGALSMKDEHAWKPLLQGKYMQANPQVSRDGRWMAYFSNESGRAEVYVRPFPEVNSGKWQISAGGGTQPRWSRNGRELFYRSGDAMIAVAVEIEPTFKAGVPETLFQGPYYSLLGHMWDLSPDGKRFLMIKQESDGETSVAGGPPKINIVLNWFEELKSRVPVK